MSSYKKKLIEVALPLEAINKEAAREKSIRHGHPSTLHLWWARRPLAACRAVLFAQMVDDPSSHPDKFPTEEDQERERQRLFRIIEELVKWENSNNETVLEKARAEIRKSCDGECPPVYDPFSGGGSIPLEAQRLGLKAYGSDLNPVAVMIGKALVEIPPKFAGNPPVNPDAQTALKKGGVWNNKGAQGLAEDVRYYGQWMREEAEKRIGHLYPQVEVTKEMAKGRDDLEPLVGQKLTVIAWLWARTVASPNPALGGVHVPLVRSFDLSTKKGKRAWVEPVIDKANNSYRFTIKTGDGKGQPGTVGRQGGTCLISSEPMPLPYIRSEAKSGRMGTRLMATVAAGTRGRVYLAPTDEMQRIAESAEPTDVPETDLPEKALGFRIQEYGMLKHRDLFTPRQLVALTTFSDLVQAAREKVLADAKAAGMSPDIRLDDGGAGAEAYADAVAVYLAMAVDKLADAQSSLVRWKPSMDQAIATFARQAIPMVWDFAESNTFNGMAGDYVVSLGNMMRVLDKLPVKYQGSVTNVDASAVDYRSVVIATDPPYYDNIGYADLSDYFYVWLRRSVRTVYPELFRTMLVPKAEELVATPYRHGTREKAESFFLNGMSQVINNMAHDGNPNFPATIYYAFKQAEAKEEGIASTGWATFLQAVVGSGYSIVGTWPMRTELSNRMVGSGTNALASSIALVCRKRPNSAAIITRAEFLKALNQELPEALRLLQHGNIAPVDMAQASIGPGMAIFTRYSKVLESDDSPMTVKVALQLINTALDEYLSEQEAEYDSDTRFAITWFETHGMETGPYGEAETLATARGVSVSGVQEAGILESRGGKVRLLSRDEMPADWDPVADSRLTVWEATQHLIQIMQTFGEQAAADLLTKLGATGEVAKDLAYRLYGICERKKWADEGLAYNSLVISWPELTRLAAAEHTDAETQADLAF
jgi:putative DNA methylase